MLTDEGEGVERKQGMGAEKRGGGADIIIYSQLMSLISHVGDSIYIVKQKKNITCTPMNPAAADDEHVIPCLTYRVYQTLTIYVLTHFQEWNIIF